MNPGLSFKAVLFDLDGTLVDTAPDLIGTLMALRERSGLPALESGQFRHHASRGAAGLLEAGFADQPAADLAALRTDFLAHYQSNLWVRSQAFECMEEVMAALSGAGLKLAVVTNKPGFLTAPLLDSAGWTDRFACVIAGDTVAHAKPHPEPVMEACRRLALEPARCLFIGDDRRDVEAGRAAGVVTAVAGWGYLPPDEDSGEWGADWHFAEPADLLGLIAGVSSNETQ